MKKLYLTLARISDWIQKPIEAISAICVFAGLLAMFFQVLYRYVIVKFVSFSFPFTEEFARYTIIWLTYVGGGVCYKEGMVISLNLVKDKLKGVPKLLLYYITRALTLFFFYVVIRYGLAFMPKAALFRSPILGMSGIFLYGMPILGSVLMIFEIVIDLLGVVCHEFEPYDNRPKYDWKKGEKIS